jgi:hypothetical protein
LSGLIPLLKLIFDSGAVSPKAPTEVIIGRDATKDTPAFGKLGFKKYF